MIWEESSRVSNLPFTYADLLPQHREDPSVVKLERERIVSSSSSDDRSSYHPGADVKFGGMIDISFRRSSSFGSLPCWRMVQTKLGSE